MDSAVMRQVKCHPYAHRPASLKALHHGHRVMISKILIKNLVHTVASVSIVIWLIGVLVYDMSATFHYFLLTAVIAGIARGFMEKGHVTKSWKKDVT
jgi:hypothetical protein